MIDGNKLWSCVGSAGIVNTADISKVVFAGCVAQLPGVVLAPPNTAAGAVVFPQIKAVIRYPVTPVDGVALATTPIERYVLNVLARTGWGAPGFLKRGNHGLTIFSCCRPRVVASCLPQAFAG
jgi:hypothetical protein